MSIYQPRPNLFPATSLTPKRSEQRQDEVKRCFASNLYKILMPKCICSQQHKFLTLFFFLLSLLVLVIVLVLRTVVVQLVVIDE